MSETLSPSRMNCLLECPRKHYYKYELGIEKLEKSAALSFGSAWADFKQRWREGVPADEAIEKTVAAQQDTTNLSIPMFVAMAAAYAQCFGEKNEYVKIFPEVAFDRHMDEAPGDFIAHGRLDAIGLTKANEHVINEDKTTSKDILPGAQYWDRTFFNVQVLQYVYETRLLGWNVRRAVYEVARKPGTKRKLVPELDEKGLKVVVCDATGERALNKNGTPRQTGGEGFTAQWRLETDEEYAGRMKADILADPAKYFARKDVFVTDDMLEDFAAHRLACIRIIVANREAASRLAKPAIAWPRNVDSMKCKYCDFYPFCLQGWSVEGDMLPEGYICLKHGQPEAEVGASGQ